MKIIVVGGGILGASATYHLAKAGIEVILIDRKDKGQATDAAAGIVCPWLSQRRNKAWYQLAKGGARYYPSLIAQLEADGEENTGYRRVGAISIHTDANKLDKMEARAKKRREEAPEIGEITRLNTEQTMKLFPPLAEHYQSVHVSGAARVDGRLLREALLRSSEKYGATIINGSAKIKTQNNKVIGISVKNQLIHADKVIVTAGAWANQLLEPIGINFAVEPQKAQIIHLQLPDTDTSSWPVVMPPSDHYLLAFENNRIVIGSTHENESGFDSRVTPAGLHEIMEKSLRVAPGLGNSTLLEARVGFRPFTPGFLPVIGVVPEWEGLLIANGLGASGLTMGPYLGEQLARIALEQQTEIDLSLYPVEGAII